MSKKSRFIHEAVGDRKSALPTEEALRIYEKEPMAQENKPSTSDVYMPTGQAYKLLYHGNLSEKTVETMRQMRKLAHDYAVAMDELGQSAELTIAFRHLQKAQMFVNCHLCYVDPQAIKEVLPE